MVMILAPLLALVAAVPAAPSTGVIPTGAQDAFPTGDAPPPQPTTLPAATGDDETTTGDRQAYVPADFARFAPANALEMLQRVPGFTIRESEQLRGLGQPTGNVIFNGARSSNKSDSLQTQLSRIPVGTVIRIEIVDGAALNLPGLTGQVANLVYRADALSGQFAWRPEFRPHHTDPLLTRANVSVSGRAGPVEYQVGLDNNNSGRGGAGGPTIIFDGAGGVIERRDDVFSTRFDSPKLGARLTIDAPGSSVANINGHYQRIYYTYREDGLRTGGPLPDRIRTVRDRGDEWNYEIGGDYDFRLGPGRLKLIGLRRYSEEPFSQEIVTRFVDGRPAIGDRFAQTGRLGETIGRGEYGWRMLGGDWQLSAEAAFNSLDNVASLGVLQPDDSFTDIPFAAATGVVEEDRYEALLSYSRPLSDTISLQVIAGAEHSTITQSGEDGLTRSFLRPKGSLTASWKPSADFDVSANLRRRVLQLSFYDFLARAFLNDGNQNAGNVDLRPQQDWSLEVEANKRLGAWGSTKLRLIYRDVTDFVDIVPVPGGESIGNIPKSWAGAVIWTSTFQFDPIGWRGARLDSRVVFQQSGLRDPFTGERRQWSGFNDRDIDLALRHDIPGSDWAYGGQASYRRFQPRFRSDQIDLLSEGPVFASLFVEHKDVLGLTVRAQAGNILNARATREREIFGGLRSTSPLIFRESRDRLIGPIFSLAVRGTF